MKIKGPEERGEKNKLLELLMHLIFVFIGEFHKHTFVWDEECIPLGYLFVFCVSKILFVKDFYMQGQSGSIREQQVHQ